MGQVLVVILVILWLTGYIQIPGVSLPNSTLMYFNGQSITLIDVVVLLVFLWLINHLPDAFRMIAILLLVLWLLGLLGLVTIAGFNNILIAALVIGLLMYVFGKR